MKDNFGDRMKSYESDHRFMPQLPVVARIDGKRFSKWTKGLRRPYDEDMSFLMGRVTMELVRETHACIGYTQSDEITLIFHADVGSSYFLDGREQKMVSILASLTTGYFNNYRPHYLPHHTGYGPAIFDARVFAVPNKTEAVNALVWREQDAAKNAISMAARSVYSHKELHGKTGNEMQEMLFEKGINFNDYPSFFKRGSYFARRNFEMKLEPKEGIDMPETVSRSRVVGLLIPKLTTISNRTAMVFEKEDPLTENNWEYLEWKTNF